MHQIRGCVSVSAPALWPITSHILKHLWGRGGKEGRHIPQEGSWNDPVCVYSLGAQQHLGLTALCTLCTDTVSMDVETQFASRTTQLPALLSLLG